MRKSSLVFLVGFLILFGGWTQGVCDEIPASNQEMQVPYEEQPISNQEMQAPCETPPVLNACTSTSQPSIELKAGYFFFSNAKMRKVYDRGGWDIQISGSYPIWRWLQIYGSVEYLERYGRSLHGHQKTRIWEVPLSLGLKPLITIYPSVQYYATLGPRYFFVQANNTSSFVSKHPSSNGLGGFVNTGFNFLLYPHLFLDVFGEYSFKRLHFHSHKKISFGRTIQVGGFTFGLGLEYAF